MYKIYFYLLCIIIVISNTAIFPQNKKQLTEFTLQGLNDSSSSFQQGALFNIIDYSLTDTKEYLEQNFWDIARGNQTTALEVLLFLNSSLTSNYAYMLIDTFDTNPYVQPKYNGGNKYGPYVPYQKAEIANVLFSLNDFTKENYVLDLTEEDSLKELCYLYIEPLSKMVKLSPNNSNRAKNILMDLVLNSKSEQDRNYALIKLEEVIGVESLPLIIQAFAQDTSSTNRFYILNEYLSKYNREYNADSLLRNCLYSESNKSIRLHCFEVLLYGIGSISNYLFAQEYIEHETDTTIKDMMEYELKENVPFLVNDSNTIITSIDTMLSILEQTYSMNWISDLAFSTELKNILTIAKTNLQNGDSLACRLQVKTFQDLVDNVYKDSLNTDPRFVTIEGWKFLYWNAQYILDRLQEQ